MRTRPSAIRITPLDAGNRRQTSPTPQAEANRIKGCIGIKKPAAGTVTPTAVEAPAPALVGRQAERRGQTFFSARGCAHVRHFPAAVCEIQARYNPTAAGRYCRGWRQYADARPRAPATERQRPVRFLLSSGPFIADNDIGRRQLIAEIGVRHHFTVSSWRGSAHAREWRESIHGS